MTSRLILAAAVVSAAGMLVGAAAAESRYSLFPKDGCSALGRINPCGTRKAPAPVGDPTAGPLTDAWRRGPLDPKLDPLGPDARLPQPGEIERQTLPSQKKN